MTNKEAYQLITVLLSLNIPSGTKLEHARKQTLKNAAPFIEAYNDKLEDLNIEFCSTDEKGNIVRDARGQYIFTKENQRALGKELKRFMENEMLVRFSLVSTPETKGLSEGQEEYLREAGVVTELKVI